MGAPQKSRFRSFYPNHAGRIVLPVGAVSIVDTGADTKALVLTSFSGDVFQFELAKNLYAQVGRELLGLSHEKGRGAKDEVRGEVTV